MADPKKKFIISTVMRKTVAEDLNDFLERFCYPEDPPTTLKPGDNRLTGKIMKGMAKELSTYADENLNAEDELERWEDYLHKTLIKMKILAQH